MKPLPISSPFSSQNPWVSDSFWRILTVFFGGYAWHVSTPWTATYAALQGPNSTRWTGWAVPPAVRPSLRPRVWRGWAWRLAVRVVGDILGMSKWATQAPSNKLYRYIYQKMLYIYIIYYNFMFVIVSFGCGQCWFDRLVIHDQLFGDEARVHF